DARMRSSGSSRHEDSADRKRECQDAASTSGVASIEATRVHVCSIEISCKPAWSRQRNHASQASTAVESVNGDIWCNSAMTAGRAYPAWSIRPRGRLLVEWDQI